MTNETQPAGASSGLVPLSGLPSSAAGELSTTHQAEAIRTELLLAAELAVRRPRDEADAEARILEVCTRPRFAEKATYELPYGRDPVEGWSIRAAEEFLRIWRNLRTVSVATRTACHRRA